MIASHQQNDLLSPGPTTLDGLHQAAKNCRLCPLWEPATQMVFGDGPKDAAMMLVGEQPGNDEDLAGLPFVGPAGRLLRQALETAGIKREDVYITNAVKHFKFVQQGKRRLHQKPGSLEVRACNTWLVGEVRLLSPELIVCLGATAGQALLGKDFRVGRDRGRILKSPFGPIFGTIHPSAILRAPDLETQKQMLRQFVVDLRDAQKHLGHKAVQHRTMAQGHAPDAGHFST